MSNKKVRRTIDDLNPYELMQLDSARGLDLSVPKTFRNRLGLRPSLAMYNMAIRQHVYSGAPIPEFRDI